MSFDNVNKMAGNEYKPWSKYRFISCHGFKLCDWGLSIFVCYGLADSNIMQTICLTKVNDLWIRTLAFATKDTYLYSKIYHLLKIHLNYRDIWVGRQAGAQIQWDDHFSVSATDFLSTVFIQPLCTQCLVYCTGKWVAGDIMFHFPGWNRLIAHLQTVMAQIQLFANRETSRQSRLGRSRDITLTQFLVRVTLTDYRLWLK